MSRALVLSVLCAGCVAPVAPNVRADLLAHVPLDATPHDLACSLADEVGPRLAGSEGDALAVQWALAKMKSLGLSNVHAEKVTVPHWVRGVETADLVVPVKRHLAVTALGGSVATPPSGLEAEVLRVESLQALEAVPREKVEGRIVFFDKVMERTVSGKGYGKTVDVRRSGASEAAKKGAVASLIRTVGTSDARFPHTGAMRYDEGVTKIPAGALSVPDAELLTRTLARGEPVRLKLVLTPHAEGEAESANVIGEVRGASKPDELVLLGAHLDSWDLGDGAIDDAAGVGVVLDVARRMVSSPSARTVRVVLFANEENGLRGAKAYAEGHREDHHMAAMEVDSGSGAALGVIYTEGAKGDAAMAGLTPALSKLGLPAAKPGDAGGADTGELKGVLQVELDQDRARYFDLHHSADDTCDKIDAVEISQVAAVAFEVTKHLAH